MAETIIIAVIGSTGLWTVVNQVISAIIEKRKRKGDSFIGIYYYLLMEKCEYYLERGWIETEELADLDRYLYQPYHDKGGNGTAEKMMKKVESLPNSAPKG